MLTHSFLHSELHSKACANCGKLEGVDELAAIHAACMKCRRCYYCSINCQKEHWNEGKHKFNCVSPLNQILMQKSMHTRGMQKSMHTRGKDPSIQNSTPPRTPPKENIQQYNSNYLNVGTCALEETVWVADVAEGQDPCSPFHPECYSGGMTQACRFYRQEILRIEQLYEKAIKRWLVILSKKAHDIVPNEIDRENMKVAFKMVQECAVAGLTDAEVTLGQFYDEGQGVPKNPVLALKWLLKAAVDGGNTIAQTHVGMIYHFGRKGIRQDYKLALHYYRLAAEQGQSEAMLNLGVMSRDGLGAAPNHSAAVFWFRQAADRGTIDATYNLARMILTGRGIQQNYQSALTLFQAAANQGSNPAAFNLGILYRDGIGVHKNLRTAMSWFKMAAERGDNRSQEILNALLITKKSRIYKSL